ncbi:MAG TPA: hypothetical protein VNH41_05165 [Steroidobacteraceae bacterium]|nr:hypothetical protein [Steroidobacteraceae bacterium]
MRGVTAKKIRRIARSLGLDPKTTYGVVGQKRYVEIGPEKEQVYLPQTVVMDKCLRKAYKVAKKAYKNG